MNRIIIAKKDKTTKTVDAYRGQMNGKPIFWTAGPTPPFKRQTTSPRNEQLDQESQAGQKKQNKQFLSEGERGAIHHKRVNPNKEK